MLRKSDVLEKMIEENPSFAEKMINVIKKVINSLRNLRNRIYKDASFTKEEAYTLTEKAEDLQAIVDKYDAAVKEGIKNQNARTAVKSDTEQSGNVQNELRNIPYKDTIESNIKQVVKMNSVADLTGEEFKKGKVDLVTQVSDYFKEIGGKVNTQYGTIILDRKGVKSSIGHGVGRNKAIAFKAVPNVLEKGKIIDYQIDWKGRHYNTAVFSAPISIKDNQYFAVVVVNEGEKNRFYLHEVAITKKEDNSASKTSVTKNFARSADLSSIYSLLQQVRKVNENTAQKSDDDFVQYQDRNLVAVTEIEDKVYNRADTVFYAKKNAAKIGKRNSKNEVSVYVDDLGNDVILTDKGLRHGLTRKLDLISPVTINIGNILKNSIVINELTPKNANATNTYVLIGIANFKTGEPVIVRSIVNEFNNTLQSIETLYAVNAKKEPAATKSPGFANESLPVTDSTISISDLLDYVNKYYRDILPESVLKHYGYESRPAGSFNEDILYQDRSSGIIENEAVEKAANSSFEFEMRRVPRKRVSHALLNSSLVLQSRN